MAAETAATQQVQHVMTPAIRRQGFHSWWGAPCPDRFHPSSGAPGLRGAACGTAIFSKFPSRAFPGSLHDEAHGSCRMSEAFVRLQTVEVRILALYGFPRSLPYASERNNQLWAWAFNQATCSQIPTLIGGDFNCAPRSLPAWEAFEARGWMELGDYMSQVRQVELPPTTKDATRFDSFVIPPILLPFIHGAAVMSDVLLFDSHHPMRLELQMPFQAPSRMLWRTPLCWVPLGPDAPRVAASYERRAPAIRSALALSDPDSLGSKLRLWSATVEDSVHEALRLQHQDEPHVFQAPGLPASHRGRCKPQRRVAGVVPQMPRQGRNGGPQPEVEATTVSSRQRMRQARRVHALLQAVVKCEAQQYGAHLASTIFTLQPQWTAVLKAKGYRMPFHNWILRWPCFDQVPLTCPDGEFLRMLSQLVLYDYRAFASQETALRQQQFRHKLVLDRKERGSSWSFLRVKPDRKPSFEKVSVSSCWEVEQICVISFACRRYRLLSGPPLELLQKYSWRGAEHVFLRSRIASAR